MTNARQESIDYPKYGGLDINRLRSGPFEGPEIVIPPTPPEDIYLTSCFGTSRIYENGDGVSRNIDWAQFMRALIAFPAMREGEAGWLFGAATDVFQAGSEIQCATALLYRRATSLFAFG